MCRFLAASTVLAHVLLFVDAAVAWNGLEHRRLGAEAYTVACQRLNLVYGTSTDAALMDRLAVVCRSTPFAEDKYEYSPLMGEWSALAADHTERPEQLTNKRLGEVVVNYLKLTKLAITNYEHFHPVCVTSWRTYHYKAVITAAAIRSIDPYGITEFEAVLATEAFAQHYLQDAFSAGHMGFNRIASSNAASLLYHDEASNKGRCVANLRGQVWFTYGDDRLCYGSSEPHVVAAAASSIEEVLRAFVDNSVDARRWEDTWTQLPAFYQPQLGGLNGLCVVDSSYESLRDVSLPALPAYTVEAELVRDRTAYYGPPVMQGLLLGGSFEMGAIPLGYRNIQSRFFGGIGESVYGRGKHALLFDAEYLLRVGTTTHGTLTHEIGFGLAWFWLHRQRFESDSLRLIYAVNVEAGLYYIRTQTAFGWGYYQGYRLNSGLRTTLGVGRVIGFRR